MKDFTNIPEKDKLYKGDHFFIIRDKFPVSPGHLLIISNKLRKDYFELLDKEKIDLITVIEIGKRLIEEDKTPDGYNIGMNCGEAAGQTVFHFHCHLIPRCYGDMKDPRGGVRHSIANKGYY
jgi:diadenosine tetraphosphate (Ap4A) HIT family hydrolase